MRRTSITNIVITGLLLTSVVFLFSILIAKQNYVQNANTIQALLADRTIVNYFAPEQIETTYEVNGALEPLVLSPICTDCEQGINNMYNSDSMLIVTAPESLCDTDVERCVLYDFDPFGLNIFTSQEILRSEK